MAWGRSGASAGHIRTSYDAGLRNHHGISAGGDGIKSGFCQSRVLFPCQCHDGFASLSVLSDLCRCSCQCAPGIHHARISLGCSIHVTSRYYPASCCCCGDYHSHILAIKPVWCCVPDVIFGSVCASCSMEFMAEATSAKTTRMVSTVMVVFYGYCVIINDCITRIHAICAISFWHHHVMVSAGKYDRYAIDGIADHAHGCCVASIVPCWGRINTAILYECRYYQPVSYR